MNQKQERKSRKLSRSIWMTLAVLGLFTAAIIGFTAFHIIMWIPFLGLTLWRAFGASFKFRDIAGIWVSAAVAMVLGYMVANLEQIPVIAIAGTAVGICIMVFCIVSGRLKFFFNHCTVIYFTAATALLADARPLALTLSFLTGVLLFGLLPFAIGCVIKKVSAPKCDRQPQLIGNAPGEAG